MFMSFMFSFMAFLIVFLKHPLPMGISLIITSMMMSINILLTSNSPWFAYILFLVMIGGVLILFLYMTSLVPNENIMMSTLIIPMMMSLFYLFLSKKTLTLNFSSSSSTLIFMFSENMSSTIILLAIFLLLTLIIIVYITKLNMGPLRSNL